MARARKRNPQVNSAREEFEGEHIRQPAVPAVVRTYLGKIIETKGLIGDLNQELTVETKKFIEANGNPPAARIAGRIYNKAKQDPLVGRVLWEDVQFYLLRCTDFEQIAPAGMFTAEESGQGSNVVHLTESVSV